MGNLDLPFALVVAAGSLGCDRLVRAPLAADPVPALTTARDAGRYIHAEFLAHKADGTGDARYDVRIFDDDSIELVCSERGEDLHGVSATDCSFRACGTGGFSLNAGTFAGGAFDVRRDAAGGTTSTLTLFGSGVPVIRRESGPLQLR